jgi:phosphoglycolate phosphatase-like HAD superfamily hydrolase
MTHRPTILALDFDGVLCDGLLEYFQVAWRAYCQLWQPSNLEPPAGLAPIFYRLRPVIETGWEMPVLIHAVLQGIPESAILSDWSAIASKLVTAANLDATTLSKTVDQQRDEWITSDLDSWLGLHRFYPGVIERLRSLMLSDVLPVIVSTKEGRFIRQLLQQQGIELADSQIMGKEVQRPKHQVLREFLAASQRPLEIWFVEDRLQTLLSVQQHADLNQIKLYLADWGYNTQLERDIAAHYPTIQRLSLIKFSQDLSQWLL